MFRRPAGAACAADMGFLTYLSATTCDWTVSSLVVGFEIGIVFLGASAALWGAWLERVGPRRAGVVATACWTLGLALAAVGIQQHQLWLLWLGMGVLGGSHGIGLGGFTAKVALGWSCVVLPIGWGVWMTLSQVRNLF